MKDLYDGVVTRVSNGITTTGDIEMQSGVKQGCPLSPLLFNMVMDELVDKLNPVLGYRLPNGSSVSTMAFANDLLLVSESLTEIKSLLSMTETFMQSHELAINPRKPCLIRLKTVGSRKQLRVIMEPFLQVGRIDLPVIRPKGSVQYLGVSFGVGGIDKVMKQEFQKFHSSPGGVCA